MNQVQLFQLGQIYGLVAQCTPTEGRDFKLDITYEGESLTPTIKAEAITDMGRAWLPFCMAAMQHAFGVKSP